MIDLRSDAVTKPTPEMYEAMCKAPLGDDVIGEGNDPTVHKLQDMAAERHVAFRPMTWRVGGADKTGWARLMTCRLHRSRHRSFLWTARSRIVARGVGKEWQDGS